MNVKSQKHDVAYQSTETIKMFYLSNPALEPSEALDRACEQRIRGCIKDENVHFNANYVLSEI